MNPIQDTASEPSIDLVGWYTPRFPIIYLLLTIGSVLFLIYDFDNHIFISIDYFVIIGVIYYIYTLIIYGGKRKVSITPHGIYFNKKLINQRITNIRKLDGNRLEFRFNILWILIVDGNESQIKRLYQGFEK